MRGELQSSGARVAAERQQTEQQAEMLMEQLAIAQSTSADTKVIHLNSASLGKALLHAGCYNEEASSLQQAVHY